MAPGSAGSPEVLPGRMKLLRADLLRECDCSGRGATPASQICCTRTLWRWISLYRAQPCTAGLLLDKSGLAPAARRLSPETECEINAAIDAIFLTQPRGTYQAVCEETWRRCDAVRLRRPSRSAIVRRLKARTRSRSRRERTRAGPPRRDSEALRRLATYRVVASALRLDAGRSRSSRQSMNAPSAVCG